MGRYRKFIGEPYEPPHGCFYLVSKVFYEEYGVNLGEMNLDADITSARSGIARLHRVLSSLADEVFPGEEREGDVVLIRTSTHHVGIVVEPGWMIHAYDGGSACIECYHRIYWRNKVLGFYRYKGEMPNL